MYVIWYPDGGSLKLFGVCGMCEGKLGIREHLARSLAEHILHLYAVTLIHVSITTCLLRPMPKPSFNKTSKAAPRVALLLSGELNWVTVKTLPIMPGLWQGHVFVVATRLHHFYTFSGGVAL